METDLGNTAILAVVQPTPDQLKEAREGIPARMLEDDREETRKQVRCAVCGQPGSLREHIEALERQS
jgi:hypothetical protein